MASIAIPASIPRPASPNPSSGASSARTSMNHVVSQLVAGGIAGAAARTVVAPLDRIKILMQTQYVLHQPTASATGVITPRAEKYSGILQGLRVIMSEEGSIKSLWKGNAVNVSRVFPYSAVQFASYDAFKHLLGCSHRQLNTAERLSAGALAGITATTFTHPLDVIRLRLSVHSNLHTLSDGFRHVWAEGGMTALFKGYGPTIASVSPFIAINFACFDAMKNSFPQSVSLSTPTVLLMGAASGLFAQTVCYPLDTIRRRMQLKGKVYSSMSSAFTTIISKEGVVGLYKGMVPNAIKVVPNNAIRFVAYEWVRHFMGIQGKPGGGGSC